MPIIRFYGSPHVLMKEPNQAGPVSLTELCVDLAGVGIQYHEYRGHW